MERERRERRERREKNLTEEEVGTMFVERIIFPMIFNVNKLCLVPCFNHFLIELRYREKFL